MGIAERKEREREQRRNEIVDAAERVFFSKGIENASMDEVASEAELSKGTLYLYFKSKDELLFAISLKAMLMLQEQFEKVIDPALSTKDNLLAIGRAYIDFSRSYEQHFKILIHFEGNMEFNLAHELFEKYCNQGDDPMWLLVRMLEDGMNDGSIRNDIPAPLLAHCLWSQITGILRLTKTMKIHTDLDSYSEDDLINAHLKIMLHGILKNG